MLHWLRNIDPLLVRLAGARVLILFAFHTFVFAACYVLATLVRFDFSLGPREYEEYGALFRSSLPIVVGVQLIVGFFFGFYRGWWRYVGITDVMRLVAGQSLSLGLLLFFWYSTSEPIVGGLANRVSGSSRGVLLINWAFSLLALFGVRVLIRISRDRMRHSRQPGDLLAAGRQRVVIIGAGDAGESLAREIEHRPQLRMKVVAFVDDDRTKWNSQIRGIQVRGPISTIALIADQTAATQALIAIPSASGTRIREIIRLLSDASLEFKTIPGIDHLVSGKVQVSQLRPVNIEDLLRREEIELPGDPVRDLFKGKRVLVTGAGGTIGSELATQILKFEPEHLTLVERSEFGLYQSHKRLQNELPEMMSRVTDCLHDIRDTAGMQELLLDRRPHIVLHAAAHKHVPIGEANPVEYVRNNALATRALAEASAAAAVDRFVLISTDKAINPTSVMGASKRAAEIGLLDLARHSAMKVSVVRFGNVIGSSGSVIPLFLEQIAAGGPVTVTHPEVTRYFLRTSEAVSLVLQAATLGTGGHVFMLDMGEPVRISDLAHDLIRLSHHGESEIQVVYSGLRPGEKLYEEVRLQGESIRPTLHPQIVITEAPQPDESTVAAWLHRASGLSLTEARDMVSLLKDLIPEYDLPKYKQIPAIVPAATHPSIAEPRIPIHRDSRPVTAQLTPTVRSSSE